VTGKSDRISKLLEDRDLQQAFEDVRGTLMSMFANCESSDAERMMDISKRLNLLNAVEYNLKSAIKDGTLESFREVEKERPSYLGDIKKWRLKNRA